MDQNQDQIQHDKLKIEIKSDNDVVTTSLLLEKAKKLVPKTENIDFMKPLIKHLEDDPDQFHVLYSCDKIYELLMCISRMGWMSYYPTLLSVIKQNIALIDDRTQSKEYIDGLIYICSRDGMLEFLIPRAMSEFDLSPINVDRLEIYTKYFSCVGCQFPLVMPFLIKCMDYGRKYKLIPLVKNAYGSLEWGSTWYCTSTGYTISRNNRKNHSVKITEKTAEPLSIQDMKEILFATRGINKRLCNELCEFIRLSPEKIELINLNFLKTFNNKVHNKDSQCISKTRFAGAYSTGEMSSIASNNDDLHNAHRCACYCTCDKCWHRVCHACRFSDDQGLDP